MRLPWVKREPERKARREPKPPAIDLRELERQADRKDEAAWERSVNAGDPVERWLRRRRLW